jgi:hypothetical protein
MLKNLGIGLTADDKYQRGFEKGVLLGDFAGAARFFQDAAKDYQKQGNPHGAHRAITNAQLYDYLRTGQAQLLDNLIQNLAQIPEIERIGSATEYMATAELVPELEARRAEAQIKTLGEDASDEARATLHEQARDKFAPIRNQRLITYSYIADDEFRETAESRYFLHAGKTAWFRARARVAQDPAAASDELSHAVANYRRAGFKKGEEEASQVLANLRIARTCWVCGREMQGNGFHFEYLPSTLLPYHLTVLQKAKQDASMAILDQSQVAVCVVCKDVIINQAERIAGAAIQQLVNDVLKPLAHQVDALTNTVQQLTRVSHHH